MKINTIIVLITILSLTSNISEAVELKMEIRGDCNSQSYSERYVNFTYISDLKNYKSVFPALCGEVTFQPKQQFFPFNTFTVDNINIKPEDCEIRLIYDSTAKSENSYIYVIEFYSDSLNKSVAMEYASPYVFKNEYDTSVNLNYNITLDEDKGFAEEYDSNETKEVLIVNQNGNSLYELQDSDRDNMVVGFKYYSNKNSKEYIEYFVPNN